MIGQSSNRHSHALLKFATVGLLAALLSAGPSYSQDLAPAELARASRAQLAADIAAVEGSELRAKLINSTEDRTLAQWYAGEIQIDGRWMPLRKSEESVHEYEMAEEYREHRDQATDCLRDHEKLARWCDKHGLDQNAEVHWLHVLRFEGSHRAALAALQLTWHNGVLLTEKEAEEHQQREREAIKEAKAWKKKVKRLRRETEDNNPEIQVAAQKELRAIPEPAAIPALLEEFGEAASDEETTISRHKELVAALNSIGTPGAVELLADIAVLAENKPVRYEAMAQLKGRPLQEFVPYLVACMEMPIEASASYCQIGNRIVNHYATSQETPLGKQERDYQSYQTVPGLRYLSVNLYQHKSRTDTIHHPEIYRPQRVSSCGGGTIPAYYRPARTEVRTTHYREYAGTANFERPDYQARRNRTVYRARKDADQVSDQIAEGNQIRVARNEQIADTLIEVTGQQLDAFPKSWWNWWGQYLEEHPDVATEGTRKQLNAALLNQQKRGLARGNLVWTRRGKRPIETILPGDFVLAQDPSSGELSYQVVIAVSSRSNLPMSKITSASSELYCAPGHVAWVTGLGWQRVSKLSAGGSLHCATCETVIDSVNETFEIESFDLIVQDFHTMFVGTEGVLVHDGTPIGPTYGALPGFSPAAVADAAKLAAN